MSVTMMSSSHLQAMEKYRSDQTRDVELDRLIRMAEQVRPSRQNPLAICMHLVGHWLETWGRELQTRFTPDEPIPTMQPSGIRGTI